VKEWRRYLFVELEIVLTQHQPHAALVKTTNKQSDEIKANYENMRKDDMVRDEREEVISGEMI